MGITRYAALRSRLPAVDSLSKPEVEKKKQRGDSAGNRQRERNSAGNRNRPEQELRFAIWKSKNRNALEAEAVGEAASEASSVSGVKSKNRIALEVNRAKRSRSRRRGRGGTGWDWLGLVGIY